METVAIATLRVIHGHGQGRVNLEIARALLASGRRVVVLSKQIDPELRRHPRISWIRIDDGSGVNRLLGNLIFAWRTTRWLKRHTRDVDLVIANGLTTWAPTDLNIIHFVHSAWHRSASFAAPLQGLLRGVYQWLYRGLNARLESVAFARAKKLIAVSDTVREDLVQLGIAESRVQTIQNGVDADEFHPGTGDRQRFGLPEDEPILLFVGDLKTHRKNLDTVLRAVGRTDRWHLAIVGGGDHVEQSALLNELKLAERTTFLGFRNDLPEIMRAADALACPSRYEPFGLVVLEAMASGLPVIVSRNVGAADRVSENAGVVLDDPEDVPALCDALDSLADPVRRGVFGRHAREVATRNTWDMMAGRYMSLIEQTLGNSDAFSQTTASHHALPAEVHP